MNFKINRNNLKYKKNIHFLYFFLFFSLWIIIIIFFNNSFGRIPPLGRFLSPHLGIWQNAEFANQEKTEATIVGLNDGNFVNAETQISIDDRNVPHILAITDVEAFFLQGYWHAKERLFQMEYNSLIAEGKTAEVIGSKGVNNDMMMKKIGVDEAAKEMVKYIEQDKALNKICEAYVAGVNAYISSLTYSKYPIEYKLLSHKPQEWSIYKTALLVKLMSYQSAYESKILEKLSWANVVDSATLSLFYPPSTIIETPVFFSDIDNQNQTFNGYDDNVNNGFLYSNISIKNYTPLPHKNLQYNSNSLLVSSKHTTHQHSLLSTNIMSSLQSPNQWFEIHLKGGALLDVYGASIPGIPGVIQGFNQHIAWSFINANANGINYHKIHFENEKYTMYVSQGETYMTNNSASVIKVKHALDQTVDIIKSHIGNVLFFDHQNKLDAYTINWSGAQSFEDLKGYVSINYAQSYGEFNRATEYIKQLPQLVTYADVSGNIGTRLIGNILAQKNEYKGFVANNTKFISNNELPYIYNPTDGFILSSNQSLFHTQSYPYFLGTSEYCFKTKRWYDILLNNKPYSFSSIEKIQNDDHSSFAEAALPTLLELLPDQATNNPYVQLLESWDYDYSAESVAATIFELWWQEIEKEIWNDELKQQSFITLTQPSIFTTLYMLQNNDKDNNCIDNKNTSVVETWEMIVEQTFNKILPVVNKLKDKNMLQYKYQKQYLFTHILDRPSLSIVYGYAYGLKDKSIAPISKKDKINSSWQMILEMSIPIKASTFLPLGQSGNPCSPYYYNSQILSNQKQLTPIRWISRNTTQEGVKAVIKFKTTSK